MKKKISKTEQQIQHLIDRRNARFTYVEKDKDGQIGTKGKLLFLLNTLGSCLGTPVLFYMSFHVIRIYSMTGIPLQEFLPDLFFGAALTVLVDFWIGLFYDLLVERGYWKIKGCFTIIGTLLMLFCVLFMFNVASSPEEYRVQFRVGMITLSLAYTLANTTTFKNSVSFIASPAHRSRLLNAEHLIRSFFMLVYICFPYWIKFYTSDCDCSELCGATPGDRECNRCLNRCDNFKEGNPYYYYTNLSFMILFAVVTIICEFAIEPRSDEKDIGMAPTFNRRMAEILRNGLVKKTFLVSLLQYMIYFALAFWMNYWLNNESATTVDCTLKLTSWSYFCTKSWMKQVAFIIVIVIAAAVYFYSLKWNPMKYALTEFSLIVIIGGILLTYIGFNEIRNYILIMLMASVFYSSIPVNKLLFSDGMYYDEYLTGNSQPFLTSVLFNSTGKFGFYASLAFQIMCLDGPYVLNGRDDAASDGLGVVIIVATILIYIINQFIMDYDIPNFFKIQFAIERNLDDDDTKNFKIIDPITGQNIKKPVVAHGSEAEKRIIMLFYNLDPQDDLKLAFHGKFHQLRYRSLARLGAYILAMAGFITLFVIFYDDLKENWWGWLAFFTLIGAIICGYAILYNVFVWLTVEKLDQIAHDVELHRNHAHTIKEFGELADAKRDTSDEERDRKEREEHVHLLSEDQEEIFK